MGWVPLITEFIRSGYANKSILQVQPYDWHEKLSKLMSTLQLRYGKSLHYSPLAITDVLPGRIYASKHEDGMWYRTSVIKVIHSGSISVFYCDYGYYANLTLHQLLPLDPEFMELPYQAIKAKLSGEFGPVLKVVL